MRRRINGYADGFASEEGAVCQVGCKMQPLAVMPGTNGNCHRGIFRSHCPQIKPGSLAHQNAHQRSAQQGPQAISNGIHQHRQVRL